MNVAEVDSRSSERKARDERIAAEPPLPPPELPPNAEPLSMEAHRSRRTHPVAIAGIVEIAEDDTDRQRDAWCDLGLQLQGAEEAGVIRT